MDRETREIVSESSRETYQWGLSLAAVLRSGDVVAMTGNLGSGKTVLAKGICAGLDVAVPVTSPSFAIIQEYPGPRPVAHFDFYRLESPDAIEALGVAETYWEGPWISLVEWAERAGSLLPPDHIAVRMDREYGNRKLKENQRRLIIRAPAGRGLPGLAI